MSRPVEVTDGVFVLLEHVSRVTVNPPTTDHYGYAYGWRVTIHDDSGGATLLFERPHRWYPSGTDAKVIPTDARNAAGELQGRDETEARAVAERFLGLIASGAT